jgi:putative DNA primase/helicase
VSARDDLRRAARGELSANSRGEARVVARRASEIKPETVSWLWRGWLPLGMLSLLAGLPGLGKSTLALQLAADLTRGEVDGALAGTPADALIVTYEDALAETVVPRLMAANADLERIHLLAAERVGESIDLTRSVSEIDRLAARHDARLLVVDPLVAGLPVGGVSSHVDQDVRRCWRRSP